MSNLLTGLLKIDKIEIGGSLNSPATLDKYSDVDMEIFLSDNTPIDIEAVLAAASKQFAPVFGYEVISHSRKDAIRVCLENGMRFDLIFRYNCDKIPQAEDATLSGKVNAIANQFWFYAAMILVKLGRKDNLIAAHLTLEMCQLIIVIQMLVRDSSKGTNIHRFGDGERVPILHHLPYATKSPLLDCATANEILALLFLAASQMDEALHKLELGHDGKADKLNLLAKHFVPADEGGMD